MDPATLIGGRRSASASSSSPNVMEGGDPTSSSPPAAAPGVRRHVGAAMAGGTMRHQRRGQALKRALTSKAPDRRAGPVVVSSWPRRPAARACWRSRTRAKDGRGPVPAQGPGAGHRRHRPRGAARDPRGRGRRQAGRRQAARQVLHRHGRLRARPSASSAPSWAWCTCWRTSAQPDELGHLIAGAFVATLWGVLSRQRDLAADRQPAQAARRARVRADGAGHRGHAGDPGRLQPAPRRPEAASLLPPEPARPEAKAA